MCGRFFFEIAKDYHRLFSIFFFLFPFFIQQTRVYNLGVFYFYFFFIHISVRSSFFVVQCVHFPNVVEFNEREKFCIYLFCIHVCIEHAIFLFSKNDRAKNLNAFVSILFVYYDKYKYYMYAVYVRVTWIILINFISFCFRSHVSKNVHVRILCAKLQKKYSRMCTISIVYCMVWLADGKRGRRKITCLSRYSLIICINYECVWVCSNVRLYSGNSVFRQIFHNEIVFKELRILYALLMCDFFHFE